MTPENFTYWLQGFAELNQSAPTDEQWTVIRDHLALVFKKVTPARGGVVDLGKTYFVDNLRFRDAQFLKTIC